jgi:pimeloyl-ACP methyl ester carboxylesterase
MPAAQQPITGVAAGVPFTALAPADAPSDAMPLVVVWHMMDAPRSDAAFAAAVPLTGVPAWRVYLGMPWTGRRPYADGPAVAAEDPMMRYLDPVVRQASGEFPAALAELRERLPIGDGPIAVVGGSLGGAVALDVLIRHDEPICVAALINPAIRARTVVDLISGTTGRPYRWDGVSREAADRLDFVAHADQLAARRSPPPPLLVVSGDLDHPGFRPDAEDLVAALRTRYADAGHVRLTAVPGLAHPLAEPPGTEPAPQTPGAARVDAAVTDWLRTHLPLR